MRELNFWASHGYSLGLYSHHTGIFIITCSNGDYTLADNLYLATSLFNEHKAKLSKPALFPLPKRG